jgi:hypothetical protein
MAIGKISGPLLKENLLREGIDLAFETDLLYLDVNNRRVGIKTSTPTHDLTVNGTTRTTNLEATSTANIGNITISGDQIQSNTSTLILSPSLGGYVQAQTKFVVDNVEIENNSISTNGVNTDLNITPTGTGKVNVNANMEVFGDLHATGTITADGSLTLGDANTDSIDFNADIASDIIPDVDNTYQLGTTTQRWKDLWVQNLQADNVSTGSFNIAGIDITTRPGNTYYVSVNGADGNTGTHPQDPLSSVGRALDLATAGDTVYIYPGTYQETLPLVIPAGVTVKGAGIRSVTIEPDSDVTVDMFLLNGETTVEDLTITGFEYDVGTNTGYAFRFAPGMKVTTRSPYIRNITVITAGSTVRLMTNPANDPRGFLAGDAGKGAYIDGSIVHSTSKEASMLFHSVTFITPGVDAVTMTNGVRVEWLNCFTYFANRGLYALSGSSGFAGDGKTRLKVYGISAQTLNVGDTITVENVTANPATFTTGTIESFSYNAPYTNIVIDGKVSGFEESASPPDTDNQQVITFSGGQTASHLSWADYSDFGAEIRSIGSASVYGNYGAYGDGEGVIGYLIGTNFAYIGSGRFSDNDPVGVIQANEVVELNRARLYYNTVDAQGDFRVGDYFFVDQETGNVTFSSANVTIASPTGITFTDGVNTTEITPTKVETGNIRISGNTIESTTGPINLTAANNQINITSNTSVTGTVDVTNNLTVNGNTILGNTNSDNVTINAKINSSLIPTTTATYDLGSVINNWNNVYLSTAKIDSITISGNSIATTVSNADLELRANGSGSVSIPSDSLYVNQNLTVSGTTNLENASVLGNISVTNFSSPNSITSSSFTTGDINVVGNTINTTVSNSNLELSANGTGVVLVNDSLDVTNNLNVNGITNLQNTTVTGTLTAAFVNTNNLSVAGTYTIGDIEIAGNLIHTVVSNADLELRANGTGIVNITDSATVNQNLTVLGTTNLQNTTVTGTVNATTVSAGSFTSGSLIVDDIEINGNVIRTTTSNANLELRTNGVGSVEIENFSVSNSNITATAPGQDIVLTPSGSGTVRINSNQALQIPAGTEGQRPLAPQTGMIRFNTTRNQYEGYNGSYWIQLGGVSDVDGNTYIVPEVSPGSNENRFYFYTNGQLSATLDSNEFNVNKVVVDQTEINGNVISTTATNTDLEFRPNGTGVVVMDNFKIGNNAILNTTINGITQLQSTGTGYYNITGTNAVVIPSGTNAERPLVPTLGMIRYNTDFGFMEVYDGSSWVSVAGAGAGINTAQAQDIALAIVLSLG